MGTLSLGVGGGVQLGASALAAPGTQWMSSWGAYAAHAPSGQTLLVPVHPVDELLGSLCNTVHPTDELLGCLRTWWGKFLGCPCTQWASSRGASAAYAPGG